MEIDPSGPDAGALSATAANSYLLNLKSLTAGNATGDVFNFAETGGSWSILTATGGITGFDPLEWQINASGFTNNELGTWSLGLGNQNNDLVLTYTAAASAVPEPATATLGLLAVTGLMMRRRRA